jgi:hypothetical protein
VARQGHRARAAGRRADVDLLFHRWRGNTTSAEVLRRTAPGARDSRLIGAGGSVRRMQRRGAVALFHAPRPPPMC